VNVGRMGDAGLEVGGEVEVEEEIGTRACESAEEGCSTSRHFTTCKHPRQCTAPQEGLLQITCKADANGWAKGSGDVSANDGWEITTEEIKFPHFAQLNRTGAKMSLGPCCCVCACDCGWL
jgi:hypothetical protein